MKQDLLISVVVTVYNTEKYLPRCVESLLHQTYTNLEVWLIDDGSTDNSSALCDEYAKKDPRVHVIHQKNQGQSRACNTGLDAIIASGRGDLITFADADDWLPLDAYETLINLHRQTGADIVWGNFLFCTTEHPREGIPNLIRYTPADYSHLTLEDVFMMQSSYFWDKLYTRQIIESGVRVNPDVLLGKDSDFLFRAMQRANYAAFTPQIVYYYFILPTSMTRKPKIESCISEQQVWQNIYRYCQEHHLHRALPGVIDVVMGIECTLFLTILLYDMENLYVEQMNQTRRWLCQHKKDLFISARLGWLGKLFMLFPMAMPRFARFVFRLPGFLPLLQKQYAQRNHREYTKM